MVIGFSTKAFHTVPSGHNQLITAQNSRVPSFTEIIDFQELIVLHQMSTFSYPNSLENLKLFSYGTHPSAAHDIN